MKLLIVEDEQEMRSFLKKTLESEGYTIDTAADGERGSYLGRTNEYDIILLDYNLPFKNGLEICKELRECGKHTPIIILSVEASTDNKVELLEAGADDYLAKPYSHRELLARLRALSKRPALAISSKFSIGCFTIDTRNQEVWKNEEEIYLTRKEFALFELLARNKGKIVSRGTIMEHVWDMEGDPFSKTIETHILNLRNKLEKNGDKVIVNVPGRGYKLCT